MRRNDPSPYNFKVGDKVICVNNSAEEHNLEKGKVYQVTKKISVMIEVSGLEDAFFYANRFIPATSLNKELT